MGKGKFYRDDELNPRKWYIVDLAKPEDPRILRKFYESQKQARQAIYTYMNCDTGRYYVTLGKDLFRFGLRAAKTFKGTRVRKYPYPPNCKTPQQKKTFRNWFRRKQRKARLKKPLYEVITPKVWKYPKDCIGSVAKQRFRISYRRRELDKIKREIC